MCENDLSPESKAVLRLMREHTKETTQCLFQRVDDIAKEQGCQRKLLETSSAHNATLIERTKGHEKRIDKMEAHEVRITRKVYTMSGVQAALFAVMHFFRGH